MISDNPWNNIPAAACAPAENAGPSMDENGRIQRTEQPSMLSAVPCPLYAVPYALYSIPYTSPPCSQSKEQLQARTLAGIKLSNQLSKGDTSLQYILENVVNPRLAASPGEDPDVMLNRLVPFLHNAMSEEMAAKVAKVQSAVTGFSPPAPWASYWNASAALFRQSLSSIELEYYEIMDGAEADAFRICRSLAAGNRGCLFLSEHSLEQRVSGLRNGWRVLVRLCKKEVIAVVDKGRKWEPGKRPKATTYSWQLADFSKLPARHKQTEAA